LSVSRRELFGDKNPDQEEKRLADVVKRAGDVFEKDREISVRLEKEIGILKVKAETLNGTITARTKELSQSEQRLNERIKKAGFTDETDFRLSCLDEKEREKLATREESLIREKVALDTRLKDRKETLVSEKGKALIELSDGAAEALKKNIAASDSDLKQVRQDIGAMTQSLSENKRQRERQQERVKRIDAQKKECARWSDLHELIGSADGKKFRNFAQSLTFDMMTKHANRQLRKMTDRYLLIRDSSQPLELNVIDNYQAGEIRSTKNLSGGESFIVSLALALGLSHMASRNVRVDSLFLDEGFGTLDEDALETALETLAGLQQDGKLIGVISHVPAFKERIATQIQVIPETGGRSILCGPGCQKI
jgi:exonuclease SbcC